MPTPPLKVTAEQWGMVGPLGRPMRLPIDRVFLHHTVTPVTDRPLADARAVNRIGLQRFGRMSYSVLVHPGRVIFWAQTNHVGAHTRGHNSTAIGLALVGDYAHHEASDELAYDACVALHDLRSVGILTRTPLVDPHNAVASTACPGRFAVAKVLPMLRAVAADPSWSP